MNIVNPIIGPVICIDIEEKGFKNSALIHSISESKTVGGEIGWVEENSMNKNLRNKINLANKVLGEDLKKWLI